MQTMDGRTDRRTNVFFVTPCFEHADEAKYCFSGCKAEMKNE